MSKHGYHDGVEVLADSIPKQSLDCIQLFFPDPWHKARHHKRRIVQPAFVESLRGSLKIGGVFHMATDWENYAEHMMEVMSAAAGYQNVASEGAYSPQPEWRLSFPEPDRLRVSHGFDPHGRWAHAFSNTQ